MWALLGELRCVMTSCRTLAGWTAWAAMQWPLLLTPLPQKSTIPCPATGAVRDQAPATTLGGKGALSRWPEIACGVHEGTTLNRRCIVTKTWPAYIQDPDWIGVVMIFNVVPVARVRPHLGSVKLAKACRCQTRRATTMHHGDGWTESHPSTVVRRSQYEPMVFSATTRKPSW